MAILYPDVLPPLNLEGYQYQPQANTLQSEMGKGLTAKRRTFVDKTTMVKASVLYSAEEFAVWEYFYANEINQGCSWFQIKILNGEGVTLKECRLMKEFTAVPNSQNLFNVQMELEVRNGLTQNGTIVGQPIIIDPPNGAIEVEPVYTFRSSRFQLVQGKDTHFSSDWQISESPMFTTLVFQSLNDTVNLTRITPPMGTLLKDKTYYIRVRYRSTDLTYSLYSAASMFLTVVTPVIEAPFIESPLEGDPVFPLNGPYIASEFILLAGVDRHFSTDWQWSLVPDFSVIDYQVLNDQINLRSITLDSDLSQETLYYMRVRYRGVSGEYSPYSAIRMYTTSPDGVIKRPDIIRPFSVDTPAPVYPRLYATEYMTEPVMAEDHQDTDWQVATNPTFTSIAFDSLSDTTNKTDVLVLDELDENSTYYARVRYRGAMGSISAYSPTRQFSTKLKYGKQRHDSQVCFATSSLISIGCLFYDQKTLLAGINLEYALRSKDGNIFNYRGPVVDPTQANQVLNGFAYGLGFYVAVFSSGRISRSPDGINWDERARPITTPFNDVTFGSGLFVAVGNAGVVYTSNDGSTWTSRTSGTTANLFSVTYNGTLFVFCGAGGVVRTSPDGITWTAQTSGTANNLNKVRYLNNLLLSVGDAGTFITSPDGIVWTTRPTGVTVQLFGVTFGAGLYLIAGAQGTVRTTPDLVTFTARTVGAGAVTYRDAIYQETIGGFFVCAEAGNIYSSLNAATWLKKDVTTEAGITRIARNSVAIVSVGPSGRTSRSVDDGITWTPIIIPNVVGGQSDQISTANNIFFVTGNNGALRTSPDGLTYTLRTTGVNVQINYVAFGAGVYVAVAVDGVIISSTDLITWTPRTSGTTSALQGITFANNLFVVVGNNGTILTSPNGINWTARTSNTTNQISFVMYTGTAFIGVTGINHFVRSLDGISWTLVPIPDAGTSEAAKLGNLILSLAGLNSIYSQDDGLTWTRVVDHTRLQVRRLCSTGTKFIYASGVSTPSYLIRSSEVGLP